MKKRFFAIIMVITMMFSIVGCGTTVENVDEPNNNSMFVIVESTPIWNVVYHKETKVMYTVSTGYNNQGIFTMLIDSEGKPLIYEE